MKYILTILAVTLLCGCQAQIAASHHNRCAEYGFNEGTNEFANCMMKLDAEYNQRMQNAAYSIQQQQMQQQQMQNRQLHCTSQQMGVFTDTTCN